MGAASRIMYVSCLIISETDGSLPYLGRVLPKRHPVAVPPLGTASLGRSGKSPHPRQFLRHHATLPDLIAEQPAVESKRRGRWGEAHRGCATTWTSAFPF